MSAVDPGLYDPDFSKYIVLPDEYKTEKVDLLCPGELAEAITKRLLIGDAAVDAGVFGERGQWDAYRDFEWEAKEPSFY